MRTEVNCNQYAFINLQFAELLSVVKLYASTTFVLANVSITDKSCVVV